MDWKLTCEAQGFLRRPCPPDCVLSWPLPTLSQPSTPESLGAMKTTLCRMRTCEFPLKLVHKLANPGWSDDLSQYSSECTGQEAPRRGQGYGTGRGDGRFFNPTNTSIYPCRHLLRAYYVLGTECSGSQTSNQRSGRVHPSFWTSAVQPWALCCLSFFFTLFLSFLKPPTELWPLPERTMQAVTHALTTTGPQRSFLWQPWGP